MILFDYYFYFRRQLHSKKCFLHSYTGSIFQRWRLPPVNFPLSFGVSDSIYRGFIHNHNQQMAVGITGNWIGLCLVGLASFWRDFIHQLLFLLWGRSGASFHFCPSNPIPHPALFTSSYRSWCIDFIWVVKWWFGELRGWPRISTLSWLVFFWMCLPQRLKMNYYFIEIGGTRSDCDQDWQVVVTL